MITLEILGIRLTFNEVQYEEGEKAYIPADRETWIQCMLQSSNGALLIKDKEQWPTPESMILSYARVQKIAKLIAFSIASHARMT